MLYLVRSLRLEKKKKFLACFSRQPFENRRYHRNPELCSKPLPASVSFQQPHLNTKACFTTVFDMSFHIHLSLDLPMKDVCDSTCQLPYTYTELLNNVHLQAWQSDLIYRCHHIHDLQAPIAHSILLFQIPPAAPTMDASTMPDEQPCAYFPLPHSSSRSLPSTSSLTRI